ncbi:MAG: dicarboxylate/amino acid:cation symporter [Deltaproteobacteria bacterium]|nr:dicarboxylate/amino acid:cation symporter [Deltaproteobacteria bacterium]
MPSHLRILWGFVVGIVLGAAAHLGLGADHPALVAVVTNATEPAGKLFLRALLLCVVPLVASSLVLGVVGLGDLRKLGRVGAKTLGLTLCLSAISVVVGLAAANLVRPGVDLEPAVRARLVAKYASNAAEVAAKATADDQTFAESIVGIIPPNIASAVAKNPPDMLGLMLFALFFGVALALQPEQVKKPLVDVAEAVFRAASTMVHLVMKVAPIGVGCLLFSMTSRFGFELLVPLALYVACVLGALLFHQLAVYGALLRVLGGMGLFDFLRRAQPALVTAFSTSSSNATLPTALEVSEQRLGVPREIGGFVLTIGATANQNGTALFEGVTVLFLAQVFGVDLTLGQQLTVLVLAVVAGIGTAGVPSASIPFIAIVLSQVGVPAEGIAIVLGVDRFLDMCRTVVNVGGDLAVAVTVARSESSRAGGAAPAAAP